LDADVPEPIAMLDTRPGTGGEMNRFQRYLAEEFAEDFLEGRLTRRQALKMIASITGSLVAAEAILVACTVGADQALTPSPSTPVVPLTGESPESPTAEAEPTAAPSDPTAEPTAAPAEATGTPPAASVSGTVSPDDPAVTAEPVEFEGAGATLMGYLARPSGNGTSPIVLVCHENRGLTEHIQDVTRRLAKAGYVALAVDLLSREGGTASLTSEEIPGVLGNIPPEQFVQDFTSGLRYVQEQPFALADQVGMVGFCFGGGVTWLVATSMPELKAAVPFYGPHPPLEDVPNIQAAVLAIYGELDQRINQGIPAIEEAMMQNNKTFEKVIYPNADHAFHNDTGPRYNPEAAGDAWQRTLDWFGQHLT
jgi:carboxymethylenebutenolidase